jgi:AraC-like DNA-binding protein
MRMHVPAAPLDRFVEAIWLLPRTREPQSELALPTGTVELVVDLDDDTIVVGRPGAPDQFRGPVLCGAHARPFLIEDHARSGRTLGVHFRPGGASALLPIPVCAFDDTHIEFADLAGCEARRLRDLLDPRLPEQQLIEITERFLRGRLQGELHPAVRNALHTLDGGRTALPSVGALVDASGYSHRRFNELFRNVVGLGAKTYTRVVRFQNALTTLERGPADWADLAALHGFSDQAHLVHEFRRHADMTPTEYLERRGERLNHPRA